MFFYVKDLKYSTNTLENINVNIHRLQIRHL